MLQQTHQSNSKKPPSANLAGSTLHLYEGPYDDPGYCDEEPWSATLDGDGKSDAGEMQRRTLM